MPWQPFSHCWRNNTVRRRWAAWLLALSLCPAFHAVAQTSAGDQRTALAQHLSATLAQTQSFDDVFDAQVWLVDMQGRLASWIPDLEARLALLRLIHTQATQAGVSPELVLAIIDVESDFDRFAISVAGAQGFMQVMPFWKDEIGRPEDNLTDPQTNLRYGCQILAFYITRADGNLSEALAAYNGSSGSSVYPRKVRAAWQTHWKITPLDW